jgi:hypothetical protein
MTTLMQDVTTGDLPSTAPMHLNTVSIALTMAMTT